MKQLFIKELIYAMRPIKDFKMVPFLVSRADGLLFAICGAGWIGGREKIDKPRSQLFQMQLIPKYLAQVWSGANIVNILIVTLNLTFPDET